MAQRFATNGVRTRLALAASLMLLLSAAGLAQVTIGLPPFGAFSGSSIDVVNNANLNVHLSIPIVNKAGRGLPLNYVLGYDSLLWFPVNFFGQSAWTPAQYWGWGGVGQAGTGYVAYQAVAEDCVSNGNYYYFEELNDWTYYDPAGTPHLTTASVSNYSSTPCQGGSFPPSSATAIATDGSGYTIQAAVDSNGVPYAPTVYGRDGTTINPPIMENGGPEAPGYGPGTITDSNGNELTFSVPNYDPFTVTTTDTLGTTALTLLAPAAGPSNPTTLTYTNPSGGSSQVTINYSTYTVRTNFGCYGISEFGASSEPLVSSIELPDGTSYAFTYEPTPGYSGDVTGRIASVTLPTGGMITYAYTEGNNGINCVDGSTATLTRTTPDGAWTYAHTESGSAGTTTVTDPQGNQTVYNFQGIYPTEERIYQGTSTLLETVNTCYNGVTASCNSATITPPITSVAVTTAWASGQESETVTDYNAYSLPSEVEEYGYGNGAPGALVSKTLSSYASLGNNIEDRPSEVQVYDGGGTLAAQTTYGYDQTGVTATSGTPQHVSISGSRGNLTTLTEYVTGSSSVSRTFSYFDTGNIAAATDFAGNSTSLSYSDCGNSFPTEVSQPGSLTSSMAWNCDAGLVASVTDPNSQTTSFSYDDLYRLTQTNNPDGGETGYTYNDTSSPVSIVTTTKLSSSASRVDTSILDGSGRVIQTQLNSDPAGTDYVNTSYDSVGRVASVTNPFRSASTGGDTYGYDALGRVTSVTHADSNATHAYYDASVSGAGGLGSQLCSSSAYGLGYPTLSSDEDGNERQSWTDALGRVIEVDEPDPSNGNALDLATCASYDALGDLTQVVQGSQTRTYNYDMLSRLTSASTPESGTTTYGYSDCSGDPSNVCSRTDARGVTTTYTYDALNRLLSKSYSDGTPTANFWWDHDSATFGNWTQGSLTNTKGRLRATCTSNGPASCPGGYTGTVYSYDAMGRILNYWQCTPSNCGSSAWAMTYNYDLAGDVTSWVHPAGFTLTNTINTAQQITQIQSSPNDATHPQYLAQNITYTPWGAEQTLENGCAGSGCTNTVETYAYNNRLQRVMIELGTPSNATADYCLVYNYYASVGNPGSCAVPSQGSGDNGKVMGYLYQDSVNTSLSHSAAYAYDSLNRLSTAVATGSSTYNLAFSYDRYGNMTCTINGNTNGLCPQYGFNSANNQITNSGYTYDASGDLADDTAHTYQYDAEGRLKSIDDGSTATLTYDALGQRVYRSGLSYLHDTVGQFVGGNWGSGSNVFVFFGPRQLADYEAAGVYFTHADALGSTGMATNWAGTSSGDMHYYPWGQVWTNDGYGIHPVFASLADYDSNAGQYQTLFRRYAPNVGRWLTPDPLGGELTNPQSLNRYAYALNNPTTFTDPSGLDPLEDECGPDYCPGGDDGGGFGGGGGCDPDDLFCDAENPNPFPIGPVIPPPIPPGGGGGGGGTFGGGGGSGGSSPPPPANPAPPTFPLGEAGTLGNVGPPLGFESTTDAIEQVGPYATPYVIEVLSICAGTPVCQEVLLGAAAGVLIYKGVQAGIQIYQAKGGKQNVADTGVMEQAQQLMQQNPGMTPCQALQQLLNAAKMAGNSVQQLKIQATQKAKGCRGRAR